MSAINRLTCLAASLVGSTAVVSLNRSDFGQLLKLARGRVKEDLAAMEVGHVAEVAAETICQVIEEHQDLKSETRNPKLETDDDVDTAAPKKPAPKRPAKKRSAKK